MCVWCGSAGHKCTRVFYFFDIGQVEDWVRSMVRNSLVREAGEAGNHRLHLYDINKPQIQRHSSSTKSVQQTQNGIIYMTESVKWLITTNPNIAGSDAKIWMNAFSCSPRTHHGQKGWVNICLISFFPMFGFSHLIR